MQIYRPTGKFPFVRVIMSAGIKRYSSVTKRRFKLVRLVKDEERKAKVGLCRIRVAVVSPGTKR